MTTAKEENKKGFEEDLLGHEATLVKKRLVAKKYLLSLAERDKRERNKAICLLLFSLLIMVADWTLLLMGDISAIQRILLIVLVFLFSIACGMNSATIKSCHKDYLMKKSMLDDEKALSLAYKAFNRYAEYLSLKIAMSLEGESLLRKQKREAEKKRS